MVTFWDSYEKWTNMGEAKGQKVVFFSEVAMGKRGVLFFGEIKGIPSQKGRAALGNWVS